MDNNLSFTLNGGLTKGQIKRIHEDALKVLSEVGIDIPCDRALKLLSRHKGVYIEGAKVRYHSDTVETCLKQIIGRTKKNESREEEKFDDLRAKVGGLSLRVLDLNTNEIRNSTTGDLIEMTKLADSLGMEGVAPVIPQGVPSKLQDLIINKVCWENSKNIGGGRITSLDSAEYIYQMAQVAGKPFALPLWILSPLKINVINLEIILKFLDLDRKVPMYVWTMPLMGVTAPITLRGAFVQAVAEAIGGAITLHLISGSDKISFGLDVCPFDMKYANTVYGSPEHNFIGLVQFQIHQFYGFSRMNMKGVNVKGQIKGFKSMGKEPDAQAAAERAMAVFTGALLGAKVFFAAGRIAEDELFSGEQLIIDNEIINYVSRFIKGFEFKDSDSSLELIKEIESGGTYLDHPTTVQGHRRMFWTPELFEYYKLDQWRDRGGKSIRERAREIAKKKIKEHHFEFDRVMQNELDKIYKRASQSLGK